MKIEGEIVKFKGVSGEILIEEQCDVEAATVVIVSETVILSEDKVIKEAITLICFSLFFFSRLYIKNFYFFSSQGLAQPP